MSRGSSSTGGFMMTLAFALIVVAILAIVLSPFLHRTPTVEVTACSLTSDTITHNGVTTVTFTLENNDDTNAHSVRITFSSHMLVTFMLGSEPLPRENDVWYHTENLNPSASHTQSIRVKALLEEGIAKLDYRITVNFHLKGRQFHSKNFDLTVTRP